MLSAEEPLRCGEGVTVLVSHLPSWSVRNYCFNNTFAEITNKFAEITNEFAEITNEFAEITNANAEITNANAEITNAIAVIAIKSRSGVAQLKLCI